MSGIPPNVLPVNSQDLVEGAVSGVTTEAQAAVENVIGQVTGAGQEVIQQATAQAQAAAQEELNKLTTQLKLPPDAIVALGILETIFSYEQLAGLSIEEIKERIKAAKLAFKLSRPRLPEIPDLNIPSTAQLLDAAIPDIFPNDSGLDAFSERIINQIKTLRRDAQSQFAKQQADRAKNMFELRKQLIQEESNRLLSQLVAKATTAATSQLPPNAQSVVNNLPSSLG